MTSSMAMMAMTKLKEMMEMTISMVKREPTPSTVVMGMTPSEERIKMTLLMVALEVI